VIFPIAQLLRGEKAGSLPDGRISHKKDPENQDQRGENPSPVKTKKDRIFIRSLKVRTKF
jgi:hypothetical protein